MFFFITANKEPLFIKSEWYLMDGIEMQILKIQETGWESKQHVKQKLQVVTYRDLTPPDPPFPKHLWDVYCIIKVTSSHAL